MLGDLVCAEAERQKRLRRGSPGKRGIRPGKTKALIQPQNTHYRQNVHTKPDKFGRFWSSQNGYGCEFFLVQEVAESPPGNRRTDIVLGASPTSKSFI
jgi:hypothetical protein